MSSGEIDKGRLEARDVREDHSFAAGVRIWRRHVEVEHGESPLLALTLQHRNRVGVVVQYSASALQVRVNCQVSNIQYQIQGTGTDTKVHS